MSDRPTLSVRKLLEGAIRSGLTPGLVAGWLSVADAGPKVVFCGQAAVVPEPRPVGPSTWFDLASLTKPLVCGTLALLMIRDGLLSPETTVASVLHETEDSELGERTVRQLLTHTSGLPAWAPLYALAAGQPRRVVETLCRLPLREAGTEVTYSCPGFIVLGIMLARIASAGLDELFSSYVLGPLNLHDELGYRPAASRPTAGGAEVPSTERALVAERGLDVESVPATGRGRPDDGNARFLGGVSGNSGLFGSITGVLALARSYLEPGTLLTADEIATASLDHTPGLEQARGFAWQIGSSSGCSAGPSLDPRAFGHTGFTGTSLWLDPSRGIAAALLANRVHPGHRASDLHPLRRQFHRLIVDLQS